MKSRIVFLLNFLLLILPGLLMAQSEDTIWTLDECIEYAKKNNLIIQTNQLEVQQNKINLTQSKANHYPSFSMGSSYGYNWGRSIDPTTNLFTNNQITSSGINGNVNWTLFAGNQIRNSVKQSEVNLEASMYDLEASQNSVMLDVIAYFTNVIYNQELLEIAKKQLESTEKQVERTERLVEAGALTKVDLLQLISQKATNQSEIINAQNNLSQSLLELKQLLLIPASEGFAIEVPEISLTEATLPEESVEDVYQIAEETMPEIKAVDLRVESSDLAISINKGTLYPTLSLSGQFYTNYSSVSSGERSLSTGENETVTSPIGYVQNTGEIVVSNVSVPITEVYDNNFGRQFKDNFSRSASIRLSIPVFSNLQNRSSYQRSVIQKQQQEVLAKQQRQQMRQIIETAYNDVVAAYQSYNQSIVSVDALEETFRATDEQYNLGAAIFTEWQVANYNLFQARSDLLRAKYNYIFKQKVLDFYMGNQVTL